MEKIEIKREFIMESNGKKTTLSDPDSSMSPEAVMSFYANLYPELVSGGKSAITGPVYRDDKMQYTFRTAVGTKG